ncbi:hypothetical protein ERX27_00555 [Macrococcus brunensis]|uniref:Uncharacterized protein n=1 Tax=Macrococcus brunensis TaxID=198483 RepID=A0A4R6BGF4_9STAP|nr:hypothetical protein [Macrococcus brunensis]TDL98965.1 hypothetical protein ERX27_00555 [Macrococcus brunensis]ULG74758.1 hypothetical protein MGG13_03030 [Macrococcus brunensis]
MIITLILLIGLCVWIYYCNQRVISFLKTGEDRNALIWLYVAMVTAILIVGVLVFSMRQEVISLLDVFYHH